MIDASILDVRTSPFDCRKVLQAAVRTAAAARRALYLPSGEYRVSGPITLPSGSRLRGEPGWTVLRFDGAGPESACFTTESPAVDIRLEGLTIGGVPGAPAADRPAFGLYVENGPDRGRDIDIIECVFDHLTKYGVTSNNSGWVDRMHIIKCVFRFIDHCGASPGQTRDALIQGCSFKFIGSTSTDHAIYVNRDCDSLRVIGNSFLGAGVHAWGKVFRSIVVLGNTFEEMGHIGDAVIVSGARAASIVGNTINLTKSGGSRRAANLIGLNYSLVFSGNAISAHPEASGSCVFVGGGWTMSVSGNSIESGGMTPIHVSDSHRAVVSGVSVSGNAIRTATDGVWLARGDGSGLSTVAVAGNAVIAGRHGVFSRADGKPPIRDVVVTGNTFTTWNTSINVGNISRGTVIGNVGSYVGIVPDTCDRVTAGLQHGDSNLPGERNRTLCVTADTFPHVVAWHDGNINAYLCDSQSIRWSEPVRDLRMSDGCTCVLHFDAHGCSVVPGRTLETRDGEPAGPPAGGVMVFVKAGGVSREVLRSF